MNFGPLDDGNCRWNGQMPEVHLKWFFNHLQPSSTSSHCAHWTSVRNLQAGTVWWVDICHATWTCFMCSVHLSAVTYKLLHFRCAIVSCSFLHRCAGFLSLASTSRPPSSPFPIKPISNLKDITFLRPDESPRIEQRDCRERIERPFHSERRWLCAHYSRSPWQGRDVVGMMTLSDSVSSRPANAIAFHHVLVLRVEYKNLFILTVFSSILKVMRCPSHEAKLRQ